VQATVTDLRERNRVDSRAPTVDAAFVLFAGRGYGHVTVAEICAAAGIGRRTFFQSFATKDDVFTKPAREDHRPVRRRDHPFPGRPGRPTQSPA
jgi:hypothetical protein